MGVRRTRRRIVSANTQYTVAIDVRQVVTISGGAARTLVTVPAGPKPVTPRAGVATHNTAAEFKDAVIDPPDENTFEQATKVAPRTSPISIRGSAMPHTFPPYSLSVIRLQSR